MGAVVLEPVWPGHLCGGHQWLHTPGERVAVISADVAPDLGGEPEKSSIGVETRTDAMTLLVPLEGGLQVLSAVLDPLERPAGEHSRSSYRQFLAAHGALLPEAPADVGGDHPHQVLCQSQRVGDGGAHDVRHLGGGVQRQPPVAPIPFRNHTATLHGRRGDPAGVEDAVDHDRRTGEDVIERRVLEHGQVEQHVAGSLGVNRLSTAGQGIVDRRYGRCLVVLHPDQVGCVLGGATSSRQHQGQGLADIPDPVRGQQRHLGGDELGPVEHGAERVGVSEVCGGEHGEDPWGLAGFRGLDLGEDGGGDLGPDDCDMEQTRTGDVVDEAGITGEKVLVLEPGDRCARPCGHRRPGLQRWNAITLYPGPGAERPSIESWHPWARCDHIDG